MLGPSLEELAASQFKKVERLRSKGADVTKAVEELRASDPCLAALDELRTYVSERIGGVRSKVLLRTSLRLSASVREKLSILVESEIDIRSYASYFFRVCPRPFSWREFCGGYYLDGYLMERGEKSGEAVEKKDKRKPTKADFDKLDEELFG